MNGSHITIFSAIIAAVLFSVTSAKWRYGYGGCDQFESKNLSVSICADDSQSPSILTIKTAEPEESIRLDLDSHLSVSLQDGREREHKKWSMVRRRRSMETLRGQSVDQLEYLVAREGLAAPLNLKVSIASNGQWVVWDFSGFARASVTGVSVSVPAASAEKRFDGAGTPVRLGGLIVGLEHPLAVVETNSKRVRFSAGQEIISEDDHVNFGFVSIDGHDEHEVFQRYLQGLRGSPTRQFLTYNSWYDIAFADRIFDQASSLRAINWFGSELVERRDVKIDGFVFDDGWDDLTTLWGFHSGFPHGFIALRNAASKHRALLGTWFSPWGGYDQKLEARKKLASSHGFALSSRGFSLADPKYESHFSSTVRSFVQNQGVRYLKIDGFGSGLTATGNELEGRVETVAMLRIIKSLRKEFPDLFVNLTVGAWPSPYFLRYVDTLWRGGSDSGHCGTGSTRQQWINFRDGQLHSELVLRSPLFPISAVMVHGIQYGLLGRGASHSYSPRDFSDEVWSYFALGVNLQELYVSPELLTTADWDLLASAAKWARSHQDILPNARWFGGDPCSGAVYGVVARSKSHGTALLRNSADSSQPVGVVVASGVDGSQFRTVYSSINRKLGTVSGSLSDLELTPYEVLVVEFSTRSQNE